MIAGGIGGTTGDLLMHSLDTVKTRQQGDPHVPPKYTSMASAYSTILRQEGVRRGLYGGVLPALLGSFPGTLIFFGTYEFSKRYLIDAGVRPQVAYLTGGEHPKTHGYCTYADSFYRFYRRFCSVIRLCSFRSPQDTTTASGPLQEPFFPVRV